MKIVNYARSRSHCDATGDFEKRVTTLTEKRASAACRRRAQKDCLSLLPFRIVFDDTLAIFTLIS